MTASKDIDVDPSDGKSGASPSGSGMSGPAQITDAGRQARIAERAYQFSERRGFTPGNELDDWLQAEREIETGPVRNTPPPDDPFAQRNS